MPTLTIHDVSEADARRLRANAAWYGMTLAEYMAALVKLHHVALEIAIEPHGRAVSSALEELGLRAAR